MGELRTRKRGKGWEYSFESARVDGKRKSISKGGFKTKAEALAAGTQAKAEYDSAGVVFKPSLSLIGYVFSKLIHCGSCLQFCLYHHL